MRQPIWTHEPLHCCLTHPVHRPSPHTPHLSCYCPRGCRLCGGQQPTAAVAFDLPVPRTQAAVLQVRLYRPASPRLSPRRHQPHLTRQYAPPPVQPFLRPPPARATGPGASAFNTSHASGPRQRPLAGSLRFCRSLSPAVCRVPLLRFR